MATLETPKNLRDLQRALYLRAKKEPKFRFYALYDRIYRLDVLTAAWWLVLEHKGAPGVDGMTCPDIIDGPGAHLFLLELHEDLRTKRYRPQPVKRVYLPKPDGRLRPLGIPICRSYCTSSQGGWGSRGAGTQPPVGSRSVTSRIAGTNGDGPLGATRR